MIKPHYEVVCAVIIKDDLVFCCKRNGKGECAYKWEFPGGKIEPGETKEEALLREIKEELNSEIKINKYLTTINHEYNTFNLTMHVYICELISGNNLIVVDNNLLKYYKLEYDFGEITQVELTESEIKEVFPQAEIFKLSQIDADNKVWRVACQQFAQQDENFVHDLAFFSFSLQN